MGFGFCVSRIGGLGFTVFGSWVFLNSGIRALVLRFQSVEFGEYDMGFRGLRYEGGKCCDLGSSKLHIGPVEKFTSARKVLGFGPSNIGKHKVQNPKLGGQGDLVSLVITPRTHVIIHKYASFTLH